MKTFQSRVWICAFLTVVPAVVSAQQTCKNFENGGFENDFAGWFNMGGAVIGDYTDRNYLPATFIVSPREHNFQAILTAGPVDAATLESFLAVTPGFFTNQGMRGGAAIKKEFDGNAGDIISCGFYWSGQDVAGVPGAPFNDTAFLTITQSNSSTLNGSEVFTLADIASNGNGHDYSLSLGIGHPGKGQGSSSYAIGPGLYEKGYKTFVWTLPNTQRYTLGFVSFNQTDNAFPSDLLVDNCTCTPIMDPPRPLKKVSRPQQKIQPER
jgi:hypothetical protein